MFDRFAIEAGRGTFSRNMALRKIDQLIDLANTVGLESVAGQLASFPHAEAFEAAEPVALPPPASDQSELLLQLTRRGLAPDLIGTLMKQFDGRPLEQGLIAWDVLAQSIWPQDEDELFGQLQDAIALVKPVRPEGVELGVNLEKNPARKLLRELGAKRGPGALSEGMKDLDLASIACALDGDKRDRSIAQSSALAAAVAGVGKLLALAHLPTLASVYLDFAARDLGHRPSAIQLCEVMFDAEAAARLPADGVRKGDVPDDELADLAGYIVYRAMVNAGDALKALAIFKTNMERRGNKPLSGRLAAVQTDLALRVRDVGPPLSILEEACAADELWRYGWRQRVALVTYQSSLPNDSLEPLTRIREFTGRFGNDFRCWYDAFQAMEGPAPWKLASCADLAREVMTLPHDPHAWKALAVLTAQDQETLLLTVNELTDQLMGQTDWEND